MQCDASFSVSRKIVSCFLLIKMKILLMQISYEIWDIPFLFAWYIPLYGIGDFVRFGRPKERSFHSNENYLHIVHLFFQQCSRMCVPRNCFSDVALNACLNCEWLIKCWCCLQIPRPLISQPTFQFVRVWCYNLFSLPRTHEIECVCALRITNDIKFLKFTAWKALKMIPHSINTPYIAFSSQNLWYDFIL